MTPDERLKNAIGLAMKAGKCPSGALATEQAIRAGKAKLALVDAAASESTAAHYRAMCAPRGVTLLTVRDLGDSIGKSARMAAVITDVNFSTMILKAHAETQEAETQQRG